MSEEKKKSRKAKAVIIIAGCIVLILAGSIGYGFSLINKINQIPLVIDEDGGESEPTPEDMGISDEALKQKDAGIINILIMGIDRRTPRERGRSDTMIIASIDKNRGEVKLTSLLRDMYVSIPNRQNNRINAAHAYGGPALAIKTVNKNFNLSIEHYVSLDLLGFEKLVDVIGGIEVEITHAESRIVGVKGAGWHHLDGIQALTYARIRRIGSDFQRTERQRIIMNEFLKKARESNLFEIRELLLLGLPLIETDMPPLELFRLSRDVLRFDNKEIKEYRLPVDGTYSHQNIRGMAVLVIDLEENRKLLHEFIFN